MTRVDLAYKAHLLAPIKRLPDFGFTDFFRTLCAHSQLDARTDISPPIHLMYVLRPRSLGLKCTNNIKLYKKVTA